MQEFNAAKSAILQVYPDAEVKGAKSNGYPIKVTVTNDATGQTVWSGRQQELFSKNGRPAQKLIVEALKAGK